jgi:acid phosphatase family membrane protein YuiD
MEIGNSVLIVIPRVQPVLGHQQLNVFHVRQTVILIAMEVAQKDVQLDSLLTPTTPAQHVWQTVFFAILLIFVVLVLMDTVLVLQH